MGLHALSTISAVLKSQHWVYLGQFEAGAEAHISGISFALTRGYNQITEGITDARQFLLNQLRPALQSALRESSQFPHGLAVLQAVDTSLSAALAQMEVDFGPVPVPHKPRPPPPGAAIPAFKGKPKSRSKVFNKAEFVRMIQLSLAVWSQD